MINVFQNFRTADKNIQFSYSDNIMEWIILTVCFSTKHYLHKSKWFKAPFFIYGLIVTESMIPKSLSTVFDDTCIN